MTRRAMRNSTEPAYLNENGHVVAVGGDSAPARRERLNRGIGYKIPFHHHLPDLRQVGLGPLRGIGTPPGERRAPVLDRRTSPCADLVGIRTSPHPVSGRLQHHFCVDLASGWIGDPALSGRENLPVPDEILSNFNVGHVREISIARDAS